VTARADTRGSLVLGAGAQLSMGLTAPAEAIVAGLNPPQREAVLHGDGPVLVVAGAGSGKTRVLTRRIAYLINVLHRPAWTILAVTFTNKAATEMRERVAVLAGEDAKEVWLGTFHSICLRILRRERSRAGRPQFTIYDSDDQQKVMKQALLMAQIRDPRMTPGVTLGMVSKLKNELIRPEAYEPSTYTDELVAKTYPVYQQVLRQNNAYDFDDLLCETVELFKAQPEVLQRYADRFSHVLVDEYQDTNQVQYVLVTQLASKHGNLFVVGDADQAIYGWRGADIRNILDFERQFATTRLITLDQNYRSTQNVLDAAHAVISQNTKRPEKRLWTDQEAGPLIRAFEARNEKEEAQFIAREIRRLRLRGTAEPRSCAVMYRTNAQSRALEEAFIHEGVPYKLVGTTRFYERREVKDVISYLRWLANPDDNVSLARVLNVPPRKIGGTSQAALQTWAEANGVGLWGAVEQSSEVSALGSAAHKALASATELFQELQAFSGTHTASATLEHVLDRTGYLKWLETEDDGLSRIENVNELLTVAEDFEDLEPQDSLRSMLDVALVASEAQIDESGGAATLMTMHLAKGLEFDVVFLAGMEENVFPHARSAQSPEELEEERRLCYVGITRSRRVLYMTFAMSRSLMGRTERNAPSRFILDVPEALLTPDSNKPSHAANLGGSGSWTSTSWSSWTSDEPEITTTPRITESSFAIGDKVYHKVFGVGTVVASELSGEDEEVTVAFTPKGQIITKRLSVLYSGLERA
jgi:DNA helicase-2/ATP-dependent DNA helicase PcrA